MAALHLNGSIHYDAVTVTLSVVIAIVAATAALWAVVSIRGFLTSLGASLIMGVAVTGMHYTGMAAVSVHVHDPGNTTWSGDSPTSLLLPMLIGPIIFLLLAAVVVMFDPLLVLGDGEWGAKNSRRQPARQLPQIPKQSATQDTGQPSPRWQRTPAPTRTDLRL
jgi:hypothetical protein